MKKTSKQILFDEVTSLVSLASDEMCKGCEDERCPSDCGYMIESDGNRLDKSEAIERLALLWDYLASKKKHFHFATKEAENKRGDIAKQRQGNEELHMHIALGMRK